MAMHPGILGRARRDRSGVSDPFGILVEPQATNYIAFSTAPANWFSPDGSTDSDGQPLRSSTYGILQSPGGRYYPLTNFTAPTPVMVVSIIWNAKTSNGGGSIWLENNAGTTYCRLNWDKAADGAPTNLTISGTLAVASGFFSLGNGDYRLYVYASGFDTASALNYYQYRRNAGSSGSCLFGLMQWEAGRSPTTPIPNSGGTAVSRSKDILSRAGASHGAFGFLNNTSWAFGYKLMSLLREKPTPNNALFYNLYNSTSGFHRALAFDTGGTDKLNRRDNGALLETTQSRASLVGVRTAYVQRGTLTPTRHVHALGAEVLSEAIGLNFDGFGDWLGAEDFPHILYSIGMFSADIGAAAANAAHLSGAADWPTTDRIKLYDWTGQSLAAEWVHSRASSALKEDFTLASADVARYAKAAF